MYMYIYIYIYIYIHAHVYIYIYAYIAAATKSRSPRNSLSRCGAAYQSYTSEFEIGISTATTWMRREE